jgi:hypothetical protein
MKASIGERIALCKSCDQLNALKICKQCGCFMPAKTRLKWASCPVGKWEAVAIMPTPVFPLFDTPPPFPPPSDGKDYVWNHLKSDYELKVN